MKKDFEENLIKNLSKFFKKEKKNLGLSLADINPVTGKVTFIR